MFFLRSQDGHRLAWRAAKEAEALGLASMGPEHLLLALAHPEEDTPASRVLRAVGGDYNELGSAVARRAIARATLADDKSSCWITLDLAGHNVTARAEGLAAGLGARQVTAEHLLLAVLWSSDRHGAFLFERMGASREEVMAELRQQGIRAPDAQLPSVNDASVQ